MSTTKTPPRKKPVAFILCRWKKNLKVRSSPITNERPATNKIYRHTQTSRRVSFHDTNLSIHITFYSIQTQLCFHAKAHTHISYGQECFIKEQNHSEEEEKHAEPRQPHPDLWPNTRTDFISAELQICRELLHANESCLRGSSNTVVQLAIVLRFFFFYALEKIWLPFTMVFA